jgi:hypothetical protein
VSERSRSSRRWPGRRARREDDGSARGGTGVTPAVRLGAAAALVLVVVTTALVLGADAASARPADDEDPNQVIEDDVECLKSAEQMAPGSIGTYVTEQVTPIYGQVQAARRTAWALNWLGVPVPGFLNDAAGLTTSVTARGPRWYVDEARTEADDYDNCALARHHPTGDCSQWQPRQPTPYNDPGYFEPGGDRPIEPDVGQRNGITGFLPDKCWGQYPADSYDLHYDGGNALQWDRKIWGGMTGFFHHVGKGSMQVSLGLLGFAFSTFHVLDYKTVALSAATNYQDNLVGPFGLAEIAWFCLFAFAAIKALRGKLGIAGGEIVVSLVLVTLAGALMANREGYLEGASTTMDQLTNSILAAGNGDQPTTAGETIWYVRPIQRTLFDEFVDRPFDYINFGGQITEQTCIDRRNRILWAGVPNDGGWAIRYMDGRDENDTTCDAHAVAMGVPTGGRMLIALITMAVSLGVAIIVGGAALTMLMAKVLLLVLMALAPFAAVCAILPGLGRRLAWGWVGVLVQAIVAAAGMAFVLSLFLLGFKGVVEQTDALGPFERWVVLLVIVGVIYMMRQRILGGSKTLANSVADNLTRLSPAAAHWQGGQNMGLDLRTADRTIGRGVKATAGYGMAQAPLLGLATVGGAVGLASTSWGRFRTGRISLKNLRRMERYREDAGHASGRALPFNNFLRRRALRRGRGRGNGGGPGHGRGPGGPGRGPRPGGPGHGPRHPGPRGGPGRPARPTNRGHFPSGGGQPQGPPPRRGRGGGEQQHPVRDWVRPRADGFMQRTRLDVARSGVVHAYDNTARWAGGRVEALGRRWDRRQAATAPVYNPRWVAGYAARRREIYRTYASEKAQVHARARRDGRRVTVAESRQVLDGYRQQLRAHKDVWRQNRDDRWSPQGRQERRDRQDRRRQERARRQEARRREAPRREGKGPEGGSPSTPSTPSSPSSPSSPPPVPPPPPPSDPPSED